MILGPVGGKQPPSWQQCVDKMTTGTWEVLEVAWGNTRLQIPTEKRKPNREVWM